MAAPASAVTISGAGDGVLNKTTINNTITESRFTEVLVTDVNGVSGLFTAPDPFMAPLTSDPTSALSQAFASLGVPNPVDFSTLVTTTIDISNFQRVETVVTFSETSGTVFIGDLGAPCDIIVLTGQLNVTTTNTTHIIDAFRLNVTQDLNGGGGPGPGPAPIPEPSTMLLLGSGLAGLIGWRRWQHPHASS
ncbi:MAG: hypothetical protein NPIRA01_21990 [Nitrospirales bacterium]|nr:MAG: hypothetical protein NPIRA01_21990 [Nitrospirales bacterium]